jgi:1-acyl-sn-glycerol-3-phosphate acyltransferase
MMSKDLNTLAKPSRRRLALFELYLRWYLPRHFHAIRIAGADRFPRNHGRPLLIYLNHASWWDPLTCAILARHFLPQHNHYAPMDEQALAKYAFFRPMGMFPVQKNTVRGAIQLLRAGQQIFERKQSVLWLTPEGEFCDPRQPRASFKGGLAALLRLSPEVCLLPLAVEYVFWDERLPEILIQCGEPIKINNCDKYDEAAISIRSSAALTEAQAELAELAVRRDPGNFETLLAGVAGVSFFYDLWQRLRYTARGRKYEPEHGELNC